MTPSMLVDRQKLAKALTFLTKNIKPKNRAQALLSFADGKLVIRISGATAKASAKGSWPGEARVPREDILGLEGLLPPADPVHLRVEEDRLLVGTYPLRCTWQSSSGTRVFLPVDAPLPMILRAGLAHAPEELEDSGLKEVIEQAEKTRDSLIAKAAKSLKPLGVDEIALRKLIDAYLLRREAP